MAITFPASPTDGQQFTVGARKWTYSTAKAAWLGGTSSLEVGNITGIGTGVAAALANTANATGGIVLAGGTSTLNVNGTVGATTAASGAFTTLSASSPILAPSGSASAPGYSFTAATNSGMTVGEGGTGRVTLYAGGTLMAYLDQNNSNFALLSTMKFGWSPANPQFASVDTCLLRDSAGVLGLRNGTTNAVGLNAYNTFTNTLNYERAAFNWSSNVLKIGTEKLGTGTARALDIQTDGTARISISSTGATTFTGDVSLTKTITAVGTTGAQTINKSSGAVNFAAAATSLVVTNSLVTVNSIILISKATNDTTARLGAVVAAAGSFTIYMDVAPVAETRVNFILTN